MSMPTTPEELKKRTETTNAVAMFLMGTSRAAGPHAVDSMLALGLALANQMGNYVDLNDTDIEGLWTDVVEEVRNVYDRVVATRRAIAVAEAEVQAKGASQQ